MDLYNLMSYLILFCDITLLSSPYVCLILTTWMSDSQHIPVIPLCLLVSGTKYPHNLLLNLTLFDLFIILFDWDDSHGQVSKLLKENALSRLGHEISYNVIFGSPIYIQLLLTDMVSYEK